MDPQCHKMTKLYNSFSDFIPAHVCHIFQLILIFHFKLQYFISILNTNLLFFYVQGNLGPPINKNRMNVN